MQEGFPGFPRGASRPLAPNLPKDDDTVMMPTGQTCLHTCHIFNRVTEQLYKGLGASAITPSISTHAHMDNLT